MRENQPLYRLIAEALKHIENQNYGLLKAILLELWSRLAEQHHDDE